MANTPTENKPDWIAVTLAGQLKDTSALLPLNLKAKDFDFRPADDYWSKESVQQMFDGDKTKFDEFYTKEKQRYDDTQKSDYELDIDADVFIDKWSVKPQVSYSFKDSQPDPWGRNRFGDYYTPARWSIPEAAIKEGVRLSDGSYRDVESFKGPVRLAKNSDGTYKFNENHKPYWEPVPQGEEIKSTDEIYSGVAEWAGAYGVNNNWMSEGLYSIGKTLYNFGLKSADSLLEPGRLVSDVAGGETAMELQSKLRGWQLPTSVQAQESGFWGGANLISLGVDAALQLRAMKGVNRAAFALTKNAQTASLAGRVFLTGIAAGPIAQMSREHGLNPYEAAALYGATVAGVYKISSLSDMAVNGIRKLEFQKELAKEVSDAFGVTIAKKGFNQSSVKAFSDQIGIRFKNVIGSVGNLGKTGQFAQTGVLESAEETLEQVLDSGLRGMYDLVQPVTKHIWGAKGDFNWSAGQEFQGILQAGAGGFIGGNVAHGLMRKMGHYEREKIDSFESMVALGEEDFGFRTIDNLEKAGKLSGNPDPIKRAEENRNNASLMRETLKAMVTIRDDAGLKDVLRNNQKAAGKFAEVLKKSSILRSQILLGNELHVLKNRLTTAQVGKASKEEIEQIQGEIDAKTLELENLKKGKHVSRFLTEGFFNTHAEEMFFDKNLFNSDPEFNGRLFTDMNLESIGFRDTIKAGIELRNNELTNNDQIATAQNYKDIGVTEEGINRLLTEQQAKRAPLEQIIAQNAQAINDAVGYINVEDNVLNPTDGVRLSDVYLDILQNGLTEEQKQIVESQPWYPALAELLELDKETRGMLEYAKKPKAKQAEIPEDEWFAYDFENGASTVPLDQRLLKEIESLEKSTVAGVSTYTSEEPDRLIKVIDHRLRQVVGSDFLKKQGYDIISPELKNRDKIVERLIDLKNHFQVLSWQSRMNRENTDARILQVYMNTLKDQRATLQRVASLLKTNFPEAANMALEVDADLSEAIDKNDHVAFRHALTRFEVNFFNKYGPDKEKILKELEFQVEDANSYGQDFKERKANYDYARRILSHNPVMFQKALQKMINSLPSDKGKPPTREQQAGMIQALQNAFAGDYKLLPVITTSRIQMGFSSAVNGGPGAGKTSVIIPGMAHMINSITGGKVIVSAFKDAKGSKLTKLKTDMDAYYGSKPDYISYNDDELIKILEDPATDEATAIIFDEASLMKVDYLKAVQQKLNTINTARLADGKAPLHIFYTYDEYQNGYRAKQTRTRYSITSKAISIPDTPRLSFSFRSVNTPLKSIEEMMRIAQDMKGSPTARAFEHDKNFNGVLVVKDRAKFEEQFKKLAEKLKSEGALSSLVYINTNETSKGVPAVGEFSIEVLNSQTAQGSEWDYVVVDTENTEIFGKRDDTAEVYTAVTRAKKGLIIYAPEGTPMSSVLAEVREFKPMTPASVSKEDMSKEIDSVIEGADTTVSTDYSTKKVKVGKDNKKMPDQAPDDDLEPDNDEDEDDTGEEPPSGEVTYDSEAQKYYQELYEPLVNKNGTVTLNGFFTNEGEIDMKRKMLGDKKTKENTQYYVTIAKIGSPGFQNIIGENTADFEGKYGIFLFGETKDGKRAVLGTISNAKSDEMIRNSPIFDATKDVFGTYPVDRSLIDSALYPHPWIENTKRINGEIVDVRVKHDMDYLRKELKSKGISASGILIATENIDAKTPVGHKRSNGTVRDEKISAGEPFIALSYVHSQDELMRKLRNGAIRLSDPEIQVIGVQTSRATVEDVVELLKPYMVKNKSGFYSLPDKGHEKFQEALTLYNSFWAHHQGEKQRVFKTAFDAAVEKLKDDEDVRLFLANEGVEQHKPEFTIRHLLEDYIGGQMLTDEKKKISANTYAKSRLFETMMESVEFNNTLKYSPVMMSTKTQTNYALTHASLKSVNDRFLQVEYHRIDPFKMELRADLLLKPSESILKKQGDPKIDAAPETTINSGGVYSPVVPMNLIQFMRKEFPNNPDLARKAVDRFRKEVINNHLRLIVRKGEEPQFLDVNVAMSNLRDGYLQAEKASARREEAAVNYALGRNFNALLAQYFPAINFDTREGKYNLVNVVHKTQGFAEQESQNLLTDGITNIVKTYLFSTQLPNGSYIGPRHIANLIPVFRGGGRYGDFTVRTAEQAEQALRRAAYKADGTVQMPEAAALLERFFSTQPKEKKDVVTYSTRMIKGSSGIALSDAILMFMMSAEKYMPGFTEVVRHYVHDIEGGRNWTRDERNVSFPMSVFEPSIVKTKFLDGIDALFKDASHVRKNKNTIEVGSSTYTIKDKPTADDAMKLIHFMGLKGFQRETLTVWMHRHEKGDKIPGIVQDYFVKQVERFNNGREAQLSEAINQMLDTYMDVQGLGNNNQYQTTSGRQNVLRYSSPIFHLKSYAAEMRSLGQDTPLFNNVLVKGTDYEFSLKPFNHTGVKVIDGDRTRIKSMDTMMADELLEFYLMDGFVDRIERGDVDITLPVTVYSDSGTEIMPVFRSEKWMQSPRATLETLYNSNRDYLLALEQVVLKPYREAGILVNTVQELAQIAGSISPELAAQIRKSASAVSGLHYDEKLINQGIISLKPQLVADINSVYNPENKEKFIAEIDADINDVIEFSKTIGGRESLYKKLEKAKKHTPEQYIAAFYANWLLLSSESQKLLNGSEYQYKGSGTQSFIDMVKRSRSLTSPAQFFVLRNESWEQEAAQLRAEGKPLSMELMYEGQKLSRFSKVFVVTDPESSMIMLNNGAVETQKIFDGATLVTPFTRIRQNYSTALGYGPEVGPVMKNITHSFDPLTGSKSFVKNAEFEMTPAILRNADPWLVNVFMKMVTQPFNAPINGVNNAWELMKQIDPALMDDLSNIQFKHFEEAHALMTQHGEQDSVVQETIFQSSMKTGQRAVNHHDDPEWTPTFIDITMKGIQQDAMHDPSVDSSVKPLTQLINTVAINWKNGQLPQDLYNHLATIANEYLDREGAARAKDPEKYRAKMVEIIKNEILRNDGISYRADAAAVGRISINDRNFSDKYASTVASEIKDQAVAFPMAGGHYVVHPADHVIQIFDVKDTKTGKSFTVLKEQLQKTLAIEPGRFVVEGEGRPPAYEDGIREDGITLTQLYAPVTALHKQLKQAREIKNLHLEYALLTQIKEALVPIHASLKNDKWTKAQAEIILPAEMKHEFHLEDALKQGLPIHLITADYFYAQITDKKKLEEGVIDPKKQIQANLMYEAFQERITGIMTRIPTSGFHSAVVTKIAAFMDDSMNSVFVPEALKKIQGADQDIDKGAYMTYKSLVRYALYDPNVKNAKRITTYTPNDTRFKGMVIDRRPNKTQYTGIIPFLGNIDRIQGVFENIPKEELRRIALENEVVRAIKGILSDPKNIVMANTSADEVLNPLRAERDAILDQMEGSDPAAKKNKLRYNHLNSLLRIHEMNQAGGKGITGIFANGAKAYNVAYARAKMGGNPGRLAGLQGENEVWGRFAGFIGSTVDNANEGILGPMGIDAVVAPYVNYWIATEEDPDIVQLIRDHTELFDKLRQGTRYDRDAAVKAAELPQDLESNKDFRSLYYRVDEFNLLARALVNREIPTSMEDLASYIITLENFVNMAYRDFNPKFAKFDLEKFTDPAEGEYVQDQIKQYQLMIDGSNNHTFNILDIMQVPHMKAYQRALVQAHKQTRDVKAYNILFEMHRNDKHKEKQPRQYYMYDTDQFNEDYDFVHGLFIDAYLSSRNTLKYTGHDLSTVTGRQDFINDMNEKFLPQLRKTYLNRNNSLVRELTVETNKLTGFKRIRLNDFYDMNEELRTQFMEEMARLDSPDRQKLFIYNLITYRDKSSMGSLSPFFSIEDKHDYLDFLDLEMKMDPEMAIKAKNDYEKTKSESRSALNDYVIPFKARFEAIDPSRVMRKGKHKQVDVIYLNHIRDTGMRPARTTTTTIDGIPTILVNSLAVKRDFQNKVWTKRLKADENGKYNRTLPVNTFSSERDFLKFSLELEYLKTKEGLKGDELMDAALVAVGKLKSVKYQKDKDHVKEAKNCKLDVTKK